MHFLLTCIARQLQTRALGSRGFLFRWYERRLAGDYLPASGPFDKDIREAPRPAHIALLSSLESHSAGDDRFTSSSLALFHFASSDIVSAISCVLFNTEPFDSVYE